MNFKCFGEKESKSVLFIHGMASSAMQCYEPTLKYLTDYYVILAEVDGHSEELDELVSLEQNCNEIENMGHGQYLHEHSNEYANELIKYLQS